MKKGVMSRWASGAMCLALIVAPQVASAEGDAAKGKEVFEQCSACHNVDTDAKKMGPSLKGLYKKAKMTNGKKPSDATVKEVIDKGGNGMPGYAELLSDEERNDVIAYLHTL